MSYKGASVDKPTYDYYLETDLDSFDQPVDYTKKIHEEFDCEECESPDDKATNVENNNGTCDILPIKQVYNDEVKIYCLEGTPLISSASSFCDLREIGTTIDRQFENDQSRNDNYERKTQLSLNNKCEKSVESLDVNLKNTLGVKDDMKIYEKEKENFKEGKCVTFGQDIYMNKTPLMFSRSSSVDSLNSFGQHSSIDDRSYVSVLSTQVSGNISPSELPDSPGELISPGLLKQKSTFQFPVDSGKTKDLLHFIDRKLKEHNNSAVKSFNDVFSDAPKVYDDEGKFSTTSSLSSLSFCDGVIRISISLFDNKHSNDLNGKPSVDVSNVEAPSFVFVDARTEYKYEGQILVSDVDDPIQNKFTSDNCYEQNFHQVLKFKTSLPKEIEEVFPEPASFVFEDERNVYNDEGKFSPTSSFSSLSFQDNVEHLHEMLCSKSLPSRLINDVSHSNDANVKKIDLQDSEAIKATRYCDSDSDLDEEAQALFDECVKMGMPKEACTSQTVKLKPLEFTSFHLKNDCKDDYCGSDSENDEESQALFDACVKMGMPKETCTTPNTEVLFPKNMPYQLEKDCEDAKVTDYCDSDSDLDEESQALFDSCVKMGMPDSTILSSKCMPFHLEKDCEDSKAADYCDSDSDLDDESQALFDACVKMGMPDAAVQSPKHMNLHLDKDCEEKKTNDYCDSDSDLDEESQALFDACVKMGMPNASNMEIQSFKHTPFHLKKDCEDSKADDYCDSESDLDDESQALFDSCVKMGMPDAEMQSSKIMPFHFEKVCNKVCEFEKSDYESDGEENVNLAQSSVSKKQSTPENQQAMENMFSYYYVPRSRETVSPYHFSPKVPSDSTYQKPKSIEIALEQDQYGKECLHAEGCRDGFPDGSSDVDDKADRVLYINTKIPSTKNTEQTRNGSVAKQSYSVQKYLKAARNNFPETKCNSASAIPMSYDNATMLARTAWLSKSGFVKSDSMRVYRTEDTPILSRSESLSDLSTLSFNDEINSHDYMSDSCIRNGTPRTKHV